MGCGYANQEEPDFEDACAHLSSVAAVAKAARLPFELKQHTKHFDPLSPGAQLCLKACDSLTRLSSEALNDKGPREAQSTDAPTSSAQLHKLAPCLNDLATAARLPNWEFHRTFTDPREGYPANLWTLAKFFDLFAMRARSSARAGDATGACADLETMARTLAHVWEKPTNRDLLDSMPLLRALLRSTQEIIGLQPSWTASIGQSLARLPAAVPFEGAVPQQCILDYQSITITDFEPKTHFFDLRPDEKPPCPNPKRSANYINQWVVRDAWKTRSLQLSLALQNACADPKLSERGKALACCSVLDEELKADWTHDLNKWRHGRDVTFYRTMLNADAAILATRLGLQQVADGAAEDFRNATDPSTGNPFILEAKGRGFTISDTSHHVWFSYPYKSTGAADGLSL